MGITAHHSTGLSCSNLLFFIYARVERPHVEDNHHAIEDCEYRKITSESDKSLDFIQQLSDVVRELHSARLKT